MERHVICHTDRTTIGRIRRTKTNSQLEKGVFMKPKSEFLLIIDGSSLLATSYYSSLPKAIRKEKDEEKKNELYPRLLKKDSSGRYCNALESFFHTIFTIMTFQRPTHLAICWDVSRHTFRKTLWPSYKANRSQTPAPLSEQYETAYEICEKLNIAQFRDQAYEADDFAGSLAVQMERQLPVRILTRDKDYFQLITPQTKIWYGMSDLEKVKSWRHKHQMPHGLPSRVVEVNPSVLEAEFGYSPECVCMMKALLGDRSDNIPGVRGMGETRSIALARHYSTPDELYEAISDASGTRQKNNLIRTWRSWGIHRSPYSCLTRKSDGSRPSAKEMAYICYTLGKMKTDIDLNSYFGNAGKPLLKKSLRYAMPYPKAAEILEEYGIVLNVGARRPFGRQDSTSASKKRSDGSAAVARMSKAKKANSKTRAAQKGKTAAQTAGAKENSSAKSAVSNRSAKKNTASNTASAAGTSEYTRTYASSHVRKKPVGKLVSKTNAPLNGSANGQDSSTVSGNASASAMAPRKNRSRRFVKHQTQTAKQTLHAKSAGSDLAPVLNKTNQKQENAGEAGNVIQESAPAQNKAKARAPYRKRAKRILCENMSDAAKSEGKMKSASASTVENSVKGNDVQKSEQTKPKASARKNRTRRSSPRKKAQPSSALSSDSAPKAAAVQSDMKPADSLVKKSRRNKSRASTQKKTEKSDHRASGNAARTHAEQKTRQSAGLAKSPDSQTQDAKETISRKRRNNRYRRPARQKAKLPETQSAGV